MRKLVTGTVCGVLAFVGLLAFVAPYVGDVFASNTEVAQKSGGGQQKEKEGNGLKRAALGF
jgi:hypothetical protein